MAWGKCIVCGSLKGNMTDHHSEELDGETMTVCQDCHTVIEQYRQAIENIQKIR